MRYSFVFNVFACLGVVLTMDITLNSHWPLGGNTYMMEGACTYPISKSVSFFSLQLTFDKPTLDIVMWIADVVTKASDGSWYDVKNRYTMWPPEIYFNFHVKYSGATLPRGTCSGTLQEPDGSQGRTSSPMITSLPTSATLLPIIVSSHWLDSYDTYIMAGNCIYYISQQVTHFSINITLSKPSWDLTMWNAYVESAEANGHWYHVHNNYTAWPPSIYFNFHVKYRGTNPPTGSCLLTVLGVGPVKPTKHTVLSLTTKPSFTTRTGKNTSTHSGRKTTPQTFSKQPSTSASTRKKMVTSTVENITPTNGQTTENPGTTESTSSNFLTESMATLLDLSIQFYEAQRSGDLPADNRLSWRKDSALEDSGKDGEDLTGGWYDAGDYVKFNLPMAGSTTLLTWGLIQWKDAYGEAGQLEYMYDCIKWPLDYFLKCWNPDKEEYYAQVGDAFADHSYWGRPEDMVMTRPAFKIERWAPGSDIAGETAAAMAAGSIAFKDKDSAYAEELLAAAKSLYDFAKTYQGKYTDHLYNAAQFYRSSGYRDELTTAAAWLYKATGNDQYVADAKLFYQDKTAWALSWDSKDVASQLLLYEITGDVTYRVKIADFMRNWMPGGSVTYTPGNLAWRDTWGSLRYAANTALVALLAADYGIQPDEYRVWAASQIYYMAGGNPQGMSYIIGFGDRYPVRPHHASSSCPLAPETCDWDEFSSPSPNPHLLKGALVGGPDNQDNFVDDRTDFVMNEVACDYNAGFQSAVAGLYYSVLNGDMQKALDNLQITRVEDYLKQHTSGSSSLRIPHKYINISIALIYIILKLFT